MIFEEKLKYWAENKFGKLKLFAEAMGIKQSTLSRYLSGEQRPGFEFLYKLSKLGCDINWLLSDDEELRTDVVNEPKSDYMEMLKKEHVDNELKIVKTKINKIISLINKW